MPTPNVVPFMSDGTTDLALARKIYDTNFIVAFRKRARMLLDESGLIDKRDVAGSASFRFYVFGETPEPEKEYRPGDELMGQDYATKEGDVNVDNIIVAHKVLGLKDATVSHLSVLPQLGRENGRVVALELERRILNQHIAAARTAAVTKNNLTIHNGGLRVYRNGGSATVSTAMTTAYPLSSTGASNLRDDLKQLAYLADVAQWPEEGRMLIMDAYLKNVLNYDTNAAQFMSRDYVAPGGNSIVQRKLAEIDGWKIKFFDTRVSQGGLIPDSNINTYANSTKFNINCLPQASDGYPAVLALCGGGEDTASVGMGTWLGIQQDLDYNKRNHTWLAQSYCLTGIEKMRPWCAGTIEVRSA